MFTVIVLAFVGITLVEAAAWALGLVFRLFGWTLRLTFSLLSVLLAPVGILCALVFGGLALALHVALPVALIVFVASLLLPEA